MMSIALTALGFLKRVPWQVWIAVGAALALWWAYHSGYQSRDKQADAEMAAMVASVEAAQIEAAAAQQAINDAAEARYQELAERSDNEHARNLEAARSDAARYIAAHRVRPASDSSASGGADSAADSNGAGISTPVPAGIIVGEADLLACTDLYTYAVGAHDWAAGLTPGHE